MKQEYMGMGISKTEAVLLVDQPLRSLFDTINAKTKDSKRASSLVLTHSPGFLKQRDKTIDQSAISCRNDRELAELHPTTSTDTGKGSAGSHDRVRQIRQRDY